MEQDTEQKISYHLEMLSRDDLRPSECTATEFEIKRVEIDASQGNQR